MSGPEDPILNDLQKALAADGRKLQVGVNVRVESRGGLVLFELPTLPGDQKRTMALPPEPAASPAILIARCARDAAEQRERMARRGARTPAAEPKNIH
jgi:hypothetical protein